MCVRNAFSMTPSSPSLSQTLMTLQVTRIVQYVRSVSVVVKSANGMLSSSFARPLDWRARGTPRHLVRLPCAFSLTPKCVILIRMSRFYFLALRADQHTQETLESVAGQSHSNTFVRTPSRNVRSDAQDSSNRRLKRRFVTTSGGDTETVHHRESQNRCGSQSQPALNSLTLPERTGALATEARSTDQIYDVMYSGPASNRNSGDASHISDVALLASPKPTEHDACAEGIEDACALPSQADETWTAQDVSSLGEIASFDMATMPDHVLSPSISSSYNLEDGIFEPGSAYQNLFQSLRSHVFRTAQIESVTSAYSHAPVSRRNQIAPSHSNTFGDRSTGTAGSPSRNGIARNEQEFVLPPAQEYLLWKAWTEEVSIWVCNASFSVATTEADENLA
jgi:hypothetical protein